MKHPTIPALFLIAACFPASAFADAAVSKATGYRGIWYMNQPTNDEYVYKYSGGFATYCMKHIPLAIYAAAANKTFFVYGGASDDGKSLLEMVSYYDHKTGMVPRPTVLMDKKTEDAHDNPVLAIDDAGYLWVFASSHGTARPSFLFKSKQPYSIDAFEEVWKTNFSYPQPWYISGKGFLFLHTRYAAGRGLFSAASADGVNWSEPVSYAHIDEGHYQVSWPWKDKVGSAFDYHPQGRGLNFRTNLYYIETHDMAATWQNVRGDALKTPLTTVANDAMVHDFAAEGLLVYVKDLNFDSEGHPAILFVTSKGWEPGPKNGPHLWRVARWTGTEWSIHDVTASDHNYDSGSLYLEADGTWRIIGPTDPGPQPYGSGGEIVVWTSSDRGANWHRARQVTQNSVSMHTHARRPLNANPEFYAFWADGDTRKPSASHLYFCDQSGEHAFRLPETMDADFARPTPLPTRTR